MNVPDGFRTQPYRELAKVLRERGDESGATQVLIAAEDTRYAQLGPMARTWGYFINFAVGYGHRPLRALYWSLAVILFGTLLVLGAKRAGVMAPTFPENISPNYQKMHEELHPLLYSLDVFLPFVNLHQEHYWWPDATKSGTAEVFALSFPCNGRLLRYYLWAQIIAGWLLSAIFVAGVTGLIRND